MMDSKITDGARTKPSAVWKVLSSCLSTANVFMSRRSRAPNDPHSRSEGGLRVDPGPAIKSSLDLKWLAQDSPSHMSSSDDIRPRISPGEESPEFEHKPNKAEKQSHTTEKALTKLPSSFELRSDNPVPRPPTEAAMGDDISADLHYLLQHVSSNLSDTLLSKYGNVGLSIGLSKDGKNAFLNLGQTKIGCSSPSSDTVYLISSMTKPIVALSVFILANDERNNISLGTPVSAILGQLKNSKANFLHHARRELGISDLLDLRSEFLKGTKLWEGPNGHVPWQTTDQIMSFLCSMPSNKAFASDKSFVNERNYVNECFSLAAAVIERVTNMSWGEFVRRKIFEPLEMKRSSVGTDEALSSKDPSQFAGFHSCRVEAAVAALRDATGSRTPSYAQIEEYVGSSSYIAPQPVLVSPCDSSHDMETIKSSPLAAAAGIVSTTEDLLNFSNKLLEVYNSPQGAAHHSELERGMASMLNYITGLPETYTYAAGWNRALLPWDPTILDPKPRWPGADGDNVRRLEAAMKERCTGQSTTASETQQSCQMAWPFFRNHGDGFSSAPPELALYHGGNMVGANSFWFLYPGRNIAVVVLCNTRGFFLDGANLACMVLGDALFCREKGILSTPRDITRHIDGRMFQVEVIAQRVAANYLWELVKYEDKLSTEFPDEAGNDTYAAACVGTYRFCEGIFATVSKGDAGVLVFQLYGKGFGYPLRVKKEDHAVMKNGSQGTLTMTFAMPMGELTPTGVGGSNRLDVDAFVIVFGDKDQGHRFGRFTWNFARVKGVDGNPPPEFAFKRVEG